jgi:hypothetical protein
MNDDRLSTRRLPWPGAGFLIPGVILLALAVGPGVLRAQEEVAPPPEAPAPYADEGARPDTTSEFIVRDYRARPKKVWKILLRTLEEAGYPPEETDPAALSVKTSFVDWRQKDYAEEVCGPAPILGPDYPILQMIHVAVGKMSLDAAVAPAESGSRLRIRARILVRGLDRKRRIQVMADRRSTGVIEKEFLKKLDGALGLPPT